MKRSIRFDHAEFDERILRLLQDLAVPFQTLSSYLLPFLHRSILNEYEFSESNERIEYLGDAVLELLTTEFLYHSFPEKSEGQLTDIRSALVRGRNLADIALRMGLDRFVLLSKGEIQAGGHQNPYILANTFEALLGAIYLDAGLLAAKKFVETYVFSTLEAILRDALYVDPKSHLQEIIQATHGVTPHYELLSESGADHDKDYVIGVYIESELIGTGNGTSKKKAQSHAAEVALQKKAEWQK